MTLKTADYKISLLPYSNLRYDRQNPRLYSDERYEDTLELAKHILETQCGSHLGSYLDCIENTALNPYIVVANDDGTYTVLDGNIRLAVAQLTVDKKLRKKARMNKLPDLVDVNEYFMWAAVFQDRVTAFPHVVRSNAVNNMRTWSLDSWARVMKESLAMGYTLADVDAWSEYRADQLAYLLESHNAFNQLNRLYNDRWKGIYRTSYMRKALGSYHIRKAVGLPEKPEHSDNLAPLPQSEKYIPMQTELMDWLFGSDTKNHYREFKLNSADEIYDLNTVYEDPECLEAFRQRCNHFYTIKSFLNDYNKTPSLNQVKDQISQLRYFADQKFDKAKRDANINTNEYNLIKITNITYSVDEQDNKLFTVELASKFPERHALVATVLEYSLREVTANCIVRFW